MKRVNVTGSKNRTSLRLFRFAPMQFVKAILIVVLSSFALIAVGDHVFLSKSGTRPVAGLTIKRQTLKDAAFCNCLTAVYPADSFLLADGSLQAYRKRGYYQDSAFSLVDSMAKIYVHKASSKYRSLTNAQLRLMKCLDWYNSPDLDSLLKRSDRYMVSQSSR